MKLLVLGSGLLGVTTAYELGKRGFDVTVVDRNAESAAETSYANGGQLSYSHAEPWASPAALKKLPKWLIDPNAPLVFRPRADWQMICWGLRFLRNSTTARSRANCVNILRLGLYSKEKLAQIRSETNIEFDFDNKGVLHIFSTQEDFEHAKRQSEFQEKFGSFERILSRDECLALEPALVHTKRNIVGGLHAIMDETGDAYKFCNALAAFAAQRYGVKFRYGVSIKNISAKNGAITSVTTDHGELSADGYVMAMGSYSPVYLRQIGIDVPIYPMKGYSITLKTNEFCPNVSLTDGTHKIVYSRLGDRLRVAGTAEFAGHNQDINEKRIIPIVKAVQRLFPRADWNQEIQKWACLRPSTPDGPPILGTTPYRNLFMGTGHGTLGWTQAAGSANIIADIIEGKTPAISLNGLTLERYA